ncbi:hypothetical protein [Streptomyces monashensis]|uniref:Uncharacterized protein n=1 Tax=Streptomyces monashensis TaxID=1678012 RepID=A0A1S2PIJ5_9ACTN|nr:hypothetical protein [Streptomyces monashensis]OIJ93609.1 hypothetical protein BIV23_37210 [Streptomyces monashensis]
MAADAYAQLADTLERLADVVAPKRLVDVLDIEDLSQRTGIPSETVVVLLEGGRVEETSVNDRVRQRLAFLRETRRRPDGRRYTLEELGKITGGVTRQTMQKWRDNGTPSIEAADLLRRYFDLPAGFMTADEPEALNEALQPQLRELGEQCDPFAQLPPELRRLALRSPDVAAKTISFMAAWAMEITESAVTNEAGSPAEDSPADDA